MNVEELKARLRQHGLLSMVQTICDQNFVPIDYLLMGSRSASAVRAKTSIIVALSEAPYGKSAPEVSFLLGIDHSSVYYLLRKAAASRTLALKVADARAVLRVA